jgi:hypothetical protein
MTSTHFPSNRGSSGSVKNLAVAGMLSLAVLYVVTAVLSPVPVTELVQCRPFDHHVRMCLLADRCTWHDCAEPTGCSPPKGANCVRLLDTGADAVKCAAACARLGEGCCMLNDVGQCHFKRSADTAFATASGRPCGDQSRPCALYYEANWRATSCTLAPPQLEPAAPTCSCEPSATSEPSSEVSCRKEYHSCHYHVGNHSPRPFIVAGKGVDKGKWRGVGGLCTGLKQHHSIRTTHPDAAGFVDGHARMQDSPLKQHHCKMVSSTKCACCDCTPPPPAPQADAP